MCDQATVLFSWQGELDGELSIEEGETISLLRWINPEWLEGRIDGDTGSFPAGMVDIVEDVRAAGRLMGLV